MNIRVLLVDDHAMFREALKLKLESECGIEVVGELNDGTGIVETCARLKPDMVVMDVTMPHVNGVEATRRLLAAQPEVKVVALSGFNYRQFVMEMLDAGASAFVVKSAAGAQLVQAISSAMAGHMYLCPETTELLVKSGGRNSSPRTSATQRLSQREISVLRLLAKGNSSPQIGKILHIAPGTVDVHRRNIMNKLELHNVAELTKYAVRAGLDTV